MTVGGIGHRMAEKPVRHRLQEIRTLTGADLLDGFADCVADGQHVHAIDPAGFDAVGGGVLGDVGVERDRAFDRRAHPVAVVLAEKQHRQPPERGQVQRFVRGAAGHRALAEEAQDYWVTAAILHGEGHAGRQRQMSADDGVAAHEPALRIHEVHGAALPLAQSGDSTEEFGHDALRVRAPSEAMAVIAVGRENVVIGPQRVHGAHGHSLFSDAEVAEPADLAERVHLRGPLLEASNQEHLGVEMDQVRAFHTGIVAEISGRSGWTDCQALPVYLAMIASWTGLGQGWYSLKSIVNVARPWVFDRTTVA